MFRSGIPESGILRKHKVPKENLDDLLVFGYACKLFRDDEKALYIDQGKHLIPWMCEETLRIDRYDGRGTLSDLKSCEANREGYDTTRWLGLNESERKVEQLCDEERYYSLTSNEEEELLYKEEELKRQKANEFQYNYEDSPKIEEDSSSQSSFPTVEQDDRPFVPRPELDVPADISIPKTIKENARIEKTAMFVSQQGLQMEILIKAKQSNNLQFSFMNQADSLYKYYRHVVAAFKSGRYTMTEYGNTDQEVQEDPSRSASDEQQQQTPADQQHQHYLHPSLANQQSPVPPPPPLDNSATQLAGPFPLAPALSYRPRADCAYTQLITRIKGAQQLHKEQQEGAAAGDKSEVTQQQQPADGALPVASPGGVLTVDQQQQYLQYYYTMRYYDGYKQLGEQYTAQGLDPQLLLQNTSIQEQIQQQASQYAQAALTAYMAQFTTVTPVESQPAQAPLLLAQPAVVQTTSVANTTAQAPVVQSTEVTKAVNPLLGLAHYGSDSEDEEENEEDDRENKQKKGDKMVENEVEVPIEIIPLKSVVPPEDIAVIIDKMAAYVAKNGADFENIVRSRGDPRFEFLTSKHEYNSYYKLKLNDCLGLNSEETKGTATNEASAESKQNGDSTVKEMSTVLAMEKKLPVPVSFSIKSREDSQIEIKQSGLPMEESSEEEEEQPQEAAKVVLNDVAKNTRSNSTPKEVAVVKSSSVVDVSRGGGNAVESKRDKDDVVVMEVKKTKKEEERKSGDGEEDDPMLEMIDLTDDLDDKNEDYAKSKSHDQQRALQLERRRKAAAFLRLRSMMDVLYTKPGDSQNDIKDSTNNDSNQTARKLLLGGGGSSRESTPRVTKAGDQVRARRASTQSRSSDVVEIIDDSDEEVAVQETARREKKRSKKKKSHKRKRSKSSRTHRDGSNSSSSRHKSKKHRKRSRSSSNKNKTKVSRSRSRTRSSSRSS